MSRAMLILVGGRKGEEYGWGREGREMEGLEYDLRMSK